MARRFTGNMRHWTENILVEIQKYLAWFLLFFYSILDSEINCVHGTRAKEQKKQNQFDCHNTGKCIFKTFVWHFAHRSPVAAHLDKCVLFSAFFSSFCYHFNLLSKNNQLNLIFFTFRLIELWNYARAVQIVLENIKKIKSKNQRMKKKTQSLQKQLRQGRTQWIQKT